MANGIKFKVILVCQIIDIPQTCLFEYSYLFLLRACERVVLSLLKPDAPASFPRFPPSSLSSSLAAPHFLYYRGRRSRRRRRRIRRERRNLVSKLPFGGAAASDGRTDGIPLALQFIPSHSNGDGDRRTRPERKNGRRIARKTINVV